MLPFRPTASAIPSQAWRVEERPLKSRSFYAASAVWLLVVLLAIAQSAATVAVDWHRVPDALRPNSSTVPGAITVLAMTTVGWLVAVRRPRNLVGWLMLSIALTGATLSIPGLYAGYALYIHPGLPGALWLYWLSQITWLLLFGQLLVVLPLVFPDGKLLSRRWLIPIGLYAVIFLVGVIAAFDPAATAPLPHPAGIRQLSGFPNP